MYGRCLSELRINTYYNARIVVYDAMPAILFLPYSSDYLVENQMTLITYFMLNFEILITKYYTKLKKHLRKAPYMGRTTFHISS